MLMYGNQMICSRMKWIIEQDAARARPRSRSFVIPSRDRFPRSRLWRDLRLRLQPRFSRGKLRTSSFVLRASSFQLSQKKGAVPHGNLPLGILKIITKPGPPLIKYQVKIMGTKSRLDLLYKIIDLINEIQGLLKERC